MKTFTYCCAPLKFETATAIVFISLLKYAFSTITDPDVANIRTMQTTRYPSGIVNGIFIYDNEYTPVIRVIY